MVSDADLSAAARHFARFMYALGHDYTDDAHLAETPGRVARMYAELLGGEPFDFTTFPTEGDNLIVVTDIPFVSFCAHHFLPFTGVAHIGYIPRDLIAGLSKLARAVTHFARRPQVQERLTEQVAHFLDHELAPAGVGVVLEARHECMELRGARAVGSRTTTSALRGALRHEPEARAEFMGLIGKGR